MELTLQRGHEDHIAAQGENSMNQNNLVHKFIPMHKALKIPKAKAALEKEWKKLETIQAWKLDRVKSKKEVVLEAQRNKSKVHFASLMDMSSQECGVRTPISEVQKVESYSVVILLKTTLELMQSSLNKARLRHR